MSTALSHQRSSKMLLSTTTPRHNNMHTDTTTEMEAAYRRRCEQLIQEQIAARMQDLNRQMEILRHDMVRLQAISATLPSSHTTHPEPAVLEQETLPAYAEPRTLTSGSGSTFTDTPPTYEQAIWLTSHEQTMSETGARSNYMTAMTTDANFESHGGTNQQLTPRHSTPTPTNTGITGRRRRQQPQSPQDTLLVFVDPATPSSSHETTKIEGGWSFTTSTSRPSTSSSHTATANHKIPLTSISVSEAGNKSGSVFSVLRTKLSFHRGSSAHAPEGVAS